jgi:hypothetical protein
MGRSYLARSTPGCPEIHVYRNSSLLGYLVEESGIYFDRFVARRQRVFAISTPTDIGQMLSRHPVLLSTVFADSN